MPDFLLPDSEGVGRFFYVEARGKPIVVFLAPVLSAPRVREQVRGFGRFLGPDGETLAHCVAVTAQPAHAIPQMPGAPQFPGVVLHDPGDVVARALRVDWAALGTASRTYVLDPNQRVLAVFDETVQEPASRAFEFVDAMRLFGESSRPRDIAPVLVIPRVFEPELCQRLIDTFHEKGSRETGTVTLSHGRTDQRVNHSLKKRVDCFVDDPALLEEMTSRFARRVIPEIRKAFCYRVTEAEGFRIACYRGEDRGYFRVHRDNDAPPVAYRRFAFSLNLNTGQYEGGGLRFPEYGSHVYRPDVGEVVIFSCSLLHEAMSVTEGNRFVLLGFLFGDDGVEERTRIAEQARARTA